MAANVGTGTTVTFGTPGDTWSTANTATGTYLLGLSWNGISRPVIDITTMATTGGRDFMGGDLYDLGSLTLELLFDPAVVPPMLTAAAAAGGTVSIAWAGGTGPTDIWTGLGHFTDFSINAPLEDRMTATAVFKLTGDSTLA